MRLTTSTLANMRLSLTLAVAMLVEELCYMLVVGADAVSSSELGAIIDATVLSLAFGCTFALISPRFATAAPTWKQLALNTLAIVVATFTIQCASHLFWHFHGRHWPELTLAFLDAATMAVTVPLFAAWLHFMEDQRSVLTTARANRSEAIAVIGSIAFVAVAATATPMFVSMADELSSTPQQKLQHMLELASRQRTHAQSIGRLVAANRSERVIAGALRWSDADQAVLSGLVGDYIDRTKPSAQQIARLPNNPTLLTARNRLMQSARLWLAAGPEARSSLGQQVQTDVDAFAPAVNDSIAAVHEFEKTRNAGIGHDTYLMIVRLSGGLFILAMLAPVITLMLARQQQLREALEDSRKAMSQAQAIRDALDLHAIVAITDRRGVITHVNDRFCEVSGYSREELIGKTHRIVNSGLESRQLFRDMWRKISKGGSFHATICNRRKNGELYWVETTIAPMMGSDGKPDSYISIRHDVTRLKNTQAELIAANEALEERVMKRTAALVEAKAAAEAASNSKSQFLATMSHELRTPLTSIVGYAEVIQEQATEDNRTQDVSDAGVIIDASRHLLGLISEILDLSKLEAGKLTVTNSAFMPAALLEEVAAAARPLISGGGNQFRLLVSGELPEMLSDRARLRQCLLNLLGNAAKFTANGRIDLLARREDREQTEGVCFDVRDTGIGIAATTLNQLFQPFQQADSSIERKYGGTGLGLAITRQLVERMGGVIRVISTEGKGSIFSIWVPVRAASQDLEDATAEGKAA